MLRTKLGLGLGLKLGFGSGPGLWPREMAQPDDADDLIW